MKKVTQSIQTGLLVPFSDLVGDERMFWLNAPDNNSKFIAKLSNNEMLEQQIIFPSAVSVIDGRLAMNIAGAKSYIFLRGVMSWSEDLMKNVEKDIRLQICDIGTFKLLIKETGGVKASDAYKITVLHNPEKPAELLDGATFTYTYSNDIIENEVWNGQSMVKRKVVKTIEKLNFNQ